MRRIACVRIASSGTAPSPGAEAGARLLGALLSAAPRVTPVPEHPLAFWADASGMERLGGDGALAQALLAAARGAGQPQARVGVASTCVAAALATRERGSAWRVVPPGRDAGFVARRPLAALPMPEPVRRTLAALGLSRCGELATLPADEVELLLGEAGLAAWQLARAEDARWPFRPLPPELPVAEVGFEPALESTEGIRFVLPGLVEAVLREAARRQRLPGSFRLVLEDEDGRPTARAVRPARPTGEVRRILELARLALEDVRLEGGVAVVRLEAVGWGAAAADQLDAFRPPAPDPAAVLSALGGVLARWGEEAFCQAEPCGSLRVEEHAAWKSPGREAIGRIARAVAAEPAPWRSTPNELVLCPHRLAAPEAVRVELDGSGQPRALWREGRRLALTCDVPERLSGGWWEAPYAQDVYLAAAEDGGLWILVHDARAGGWQLEGWYD